MPSAGTPSGVSSPPRRLAALEAAQTKAAAAGPRRRRRQRIDVGDHKAHMAPGSKCDESATN